MANPCQQSRKVPDPAGRIRDESGPAGLPSDEADPLLDYTERG